MTEVFIISFITSSISGLSILLTGVWKHGRHHRLRRRRRRRSTQSMPGIGGWMVAISMFLFGYTVLIGWGYYGEQFFEYMFGPRIIVPYRWFYCLLDSVRRMFKVDLVWNWGDIVNGLQVFPNVIGLVALSGFAAHTPRRKTTSIASRPSALSHRIDRRSLLTRPIMLVDNYATC